MTENNRKHWNSNEELFLIDSIKNNISTIDISSKLGRTESSIKFRFELILKRVNDNKYSDEYNKFQIDFLNNNYECIKVGINNSHIKKKENDNIIKSTSNNMFALNYNNTLNSDKTIKSILNEMITSIEDEENLNERQLKAYRDAKDGKNIFLTGAAGCHAYNTEILLYNGQLKCVQDIKIYDVLMGDDSTPRNIQKIIRGYDELYRISYIDNNESFIVNKDHILTLIYGNKKNIKRIHNSFLITWFDNKNIIQTSKKFYFNASNKDAVEKDAIIFLNEINEERIIDISVIDYIKLGNVIKSKLYSFKNKIEFPEKILTIDAYIMGGILGMNIYNETDLINAIPDLYKINSREIRLKFLAGIIDNYGHVLSSNGIDNFVLDVYVFNQFVKDIIYITQSLGIYCTYDNYHLAIYGGYVNDIPTKIHKINKQANHSGPILFKFGIEHANHGRYFGFSIDCNNRYVMGNFTITHNCGKTFVLKKIISYFNIKKKKIGITGSTGVSASLISGTTLHSFLKIGLARKPALELYEIIKKKYHSDFKKIQNLDVLIIDEISMIDNILFSKVGKLISLIKEISKPFGNIQLILCGDFTQIKPVNNKYCFKSAIWKLLNLNITSLTEQIRQSDDPEFQYILSKLRFGDLDDDIYEKLLTLKANKFQNDVKPTILYSKNINIDTINEKEYNKLINSGSHEYTFKIKYNEYNKQIDKLVKSLTNITTKFCIGLQVMITKNLDVSNRLVNGTRCVIRDIKFPEIIIKTFDGHIHYISYAKYTDDTNPEITYEYIPLKLAYAISIHKSMGSTISLLEMDLGDDIFEYGQGYTALSRGTKLNLIKILALSKYSFKCHPDVKEFYRALE